MPPPINLQAIALAAFPSDVRAKGEDYWRKRRVRIKFADPLFVSAVVQGSRPYEVEIIAVDEGDRCPVEGYCSCPYHGDNGVCKHVWALMLAIDEKDRLPLPSYATFAPSPADDDDLIDIKWDVTAKSPPPPPPPRWREALDTLNRRVIYDHLYEQKTTANREVRMEIHLQLKQFMNDRVPVYVATQVELKNGSWGKSKPVRKAELPPGMSEADFELVSLLIAQQPLSDSFYSETINLGETAAARLLPRLCARPDLTVRAGGRHHGPLTWDADAPVSLDFCLAPAAHGKGFALLIRLARGEETLDPHTLLGICCRTWLIWPEHVRKLEQRSAARWIEWWREHQDLVIPENELDAFLADYMGRESPPRLQLPERHTFREIKDPPRPELNIHRAANPGAKWLGTSVFFHYDAIRLPGNRPRAMHMDKASRSLVHRNLAAETGFIEAAKALGAKHQPSYLDEEPWLMLPAGDFARIVGALIADGWSVVAENKAMRRSGAMAVSVSSGIDWFDVHASFDYDGATISLPDLLEAARKKQEWVRLSDGSIGLLPDEWLKRYAGVAALGEEVDGRLRFKRHQAVLLDLWLAELPDIDIDDRFRRTREKIAAGCRIAPVAPPPGFRGTLRPYQSEGLGWLHFLQEMEFGGCLADDMGLGKTIQVLALLESRRGRRAADGLPPSLVVVPRSLLFNWIKEAEKFAPSLRILDHTGNDRELAEGWEQSFDVLLTTYGTLRRDIDQIKTILFDYAILDESQAIKNASAQTAKCARLIQARHRLAMSGTPVENHLGELWSLFEFLNPGLLGAASAFERLSTDPTPEQRSVLARALRPFLLRRTKAQVAKDLPDRQEDTLYCELPDEQRAEYNRLRDFYRQALLGRIEEVGLNKSKIVVLEALLRLRQAACHTGLIDPDQRAAPCAKFDVLVPQLQELIEEGHKALVFSQFTSLLDLLKTQLDAAGITYEYLDGKTRNRQARVDRFQTDAACPLFLISLKAGGVGLNLTAADYVFLLDPWWNPAVEAQAIDRTHRIGQTRKVMAYRLIARDTVEEKVLALQESKRELANAILSEDNAVLKNLTREDLDFLLG